MDLPQPPIPASLTQRRFAFVINQVLFLVPALPVLYVTVHRLGPVLWWIVGAYAVELLSLVVVYRTDPSATWGMRLVGIRVVDEESFAPVGARRALLRIWWLQVRGLNPIPEFNAPRLWADRRGRTLLVRR